LSSRAESEVATDSVISTLRCAPSSPPSRSAHSIVSASRLCRSPVCPVVTMTLISGARALMSAISIKPLAAGSETLFIL